MNARKTVKLLVRAAAVVWFGATTSCGREASSLLRQGQLPIYDFPIFYTEGAPGNLWMVDRYRAKTLLASGLNDPRGVATDRFQRVYVAEYGAGRLLRVDPAKKDGSYDVVKEDLQHPSVVAVDSFGDVFVAQDDAMNVTRMSDDKVFGSYDTVPTALAFGVDDQPVVGLFEENKVLWGFEAGSPAADFDAPINASIDGTGRVYVAQGDPVAGVVQRFHQREPGSAPTQVANGLLGPLGIAVDLAGDIFLVEQGANRIVLITYDGKKYSWIDDVEDPQYLAFTQY